MDNNSKIQNPNSKIIKILLIEDNPGDARLVQEILKEARGNFAITVEEKLGAGLKFLASETNVDVVLMDLNLPDSRGLETLTNLQTGFPHMPIVVMTSLDDEELANRAVRLGAQDYLVKGNVNGELLRRTLIYAIERKQAEEEIIKLNEALKGNVAALQAANTGLRNSRRAALNLMEDAVAARRQAEEASAGLLAEINERKRAEEELLRLNKVMKALSDSSQAVIRAKDEPEYMNNVCRIIIEDCGYSMAWIGFAENDETKSVRPVAYSGFEEGYLETLELTWADTERGRGPTGTAIRTGNFAACRNMLTDPAFAPWREQAIKRGYASSIVFPLRIDGEVFGAITIYSKEADPFSEGEVKFLTELADNLAYGIRVLRMKAAQKQAEAEILKLSEDMAARNLELETLNKEMEAFIYSVSHDLRAPLRHISGFAKIVAKDYEGRLDAQGRDYLTRIHNGSERMSKLIEDLLYLSRISRQEVYRIEFSISNKVSSIIDVLRETDPSRSVEISIEEGLTAFADPGLTDIVLSNLLGNAWKFTSKSENARIELGAFEQDGKNVYYVRDNGIGFDPNYKEKLFVPFQRLHSDKEFEGTGIGLSIVERIIRRHGGRIWADGEKGKGATFFFTLN
jgi:signal transduction histidine kinase/DNA-binding NarL/FixJ family response regulator